MTTQKEFLEIIEKHTSVGKEGTIIIKDPNLAKKYTEYLEQFASKVTTEGLNIGCANIKC